MTSPSQAITRTLSSHRPMSWSMDQRTTMAPKTSTRVTSTATMALATTSGLRRMPWTVWVSRYWNRTAYSGSGSPSSASGMDGTFS